MTSPSSTVRCVECGAELSRDATRCPNCGAVVVTLDRAFGLIAVGLLLIPAGVWGLSELRSGPRSTTVLLLTGVLVALPVGLMYVGSKLYRRRRRQLTDDSVPTE